MNIIITINKTLFVQGLNCSKLAYTLIKYPERVPPDSLGIEFRKKQGTLTGNLAKKLFPLGLDLTHLPDAEKIKQTIENKNKTLFEASARFEDLFARADILYPNEDNTFDLIEVKSDTEIKPEHIPDVSFQKYVFEKAGYTIKNVFIAHSNNEYVRQGEIDPEKYFIIEDVTRQLISVEGSIQRLRDALNNKVEPDIPLNYSCTKPYDCPLKKECWSHLPKNNVTQLYYDKKLGFELLAKGIQLISQIPDNMPLNGRGKTQRSIQIQATKEGKIHIQKQEIKEFVESLVYPIYYFDFETYAPAIPLFDKSRPWQKIPFQYSLHIEHEDGKIEHKEFLATNNNDPRPELIKAMQRDLGTTGSILVYNQNFEKSVINELIIDFPELKESGDSYNARIVDLAYPFEQFHYYNPEQQGRYSIKVILPIFSDLSYKEMEVGNGEEAFCAYEEIIKNSENKEKLISSLKKYCELDTRAEIEIVQKLRFLI